MWLAERLKKIDQSSLGAVGTVGAGAAEVVTEPEAGSFELLCHAGAVCLPESGERCLALDCADGTRVLLGSLVSELPESLADGEVLICTDSASVLIKNDGGIVLTGDVSIEGTLTVNGVSVGETE